MTHAMIFVRNANDKDAIYACFISFSDPGANVHAAQCIYYYSSLCY